MAAFYSKYVSEFIEDKVDFIIGSLTKQAGISGFHQQLHTQTKSWNDEIIVLKNSLKELAKILPIVNSWGILLEYPIARREKRIDAVLIANDLIIVIEFKVGQSTYLNPDREQLLDY